MKLRDIYELAIRLGIENDLRGPQKAKANLEKAQKKYDKLSKEDKENFDTEKLKNPYADTRILYDNGKPVKRVMVGIDIESAEILMAKQLGIDTVISHHPDGAGLADLSDVMHLQSEILAMYGVPINIAESLTKERISEVARGLSPINHYRTVDAARLFDINYACVHTPCDNLAATFLDKVIKKAHPETVGDIIDAIKTIPEYQEAIKRKAGPKIFVGHEENSTGRIALTDITGGTSGSIGMYEKMSQAGIGTIIGMHMGESHKKEAQHFHINVVIAGHMSSDSLGVNQFLDAVEEKGIEIIPCSGLIRVSRKKNNGKK